MEIQSKEVQWRVHDIDIYGTITRPVAGENLPAVILLAGSGSTDRDWCSPLLPGSNGSGRLIAERLAENGFVTLRYDKAGSGVHAKENIQKFAGRVNMQYFADELHGAFEKLSGEDGVNMDLIFALTNSEGAIHAVNYQLGNFEKKFRGFILTGPHGRSVGDVARSQLLSQFGKLPNADTIMKAYDLAIREFISEKPVTVNDDLPLLMKQLISSLETPINLPFSRELWAYNLGDHISIVKDPIMVLIGKKDIQVSWNDDGNMLKKSLSENMNTSFVFPENANHLLKHEELPLEKLSAQYVSLNYNSSDRILDEEASNNILSWLNERIENS